MERPTSLLLTSEVASGDTPIWIANADHAPEDDHLYCMGANFIFWRMTPKGDYMPEIVSPVAFEVSATGYEQITVKDPRTLLFLPGKTLDLLLRRIPDFPDKVIGYIIRDGAIETTIEYEFERELGVQLYGDKYLIVLANDHILMINIHYPKSVHRIDGIPPDGSLAVCDDTAVIWSRYTSQKIVVNLDSRTVDLPVKIDEMAADEVVKAVSVNCLVTITPSAVRMYDWSGKRVLDEPIGFGKEFEKEGVLDSSNSKNIAISLTNVLTKQRTVYWFEKGTLKSLVVGSINTRAMFLFGERVYGAYSTLECTLITRLPLYKENTKQTFAVADYGNARIHRYLKISATAGWILEVEHPLKGISRLIIRPIFGRTIRPNVCTKYRLPESGPIITVMDVIPAFVYDSGGQVRFWICESMEMKPQTSVSLKQPRTYLIKLYMWDKVADLIKPTGIQYELFDLPPRGFHAAWFQTDSWIVLAMGNMAYVFNHEGAKARNKPFMVPHVGVGTRGPVNIIQVRGFDQSLWFLMGYFQEHYPVLWEVMVWDGSTEEYSVRFEEPIEMASAVATGIRRKGPSGRALGRAELVIAAVRPEDMWYHVGIDFNTKKSFRKVFYENQIPGVLCENTDAKGRVYFSKGHDLNIYIPGQGTFEKFSDLLNVAYNEARLEVMKENYIHAIKVNLLTVWVATTSRFYLLDTNLLQERDVKGRLLPSKPLLTFDLSGFRQEFQIPNSIIPYPSHIDKMDREAVFGNDRYTWLSSKPMILYRKPPLMEKENHPSLVFTEKGRMLVIVTYIEEHTQLRGTQELEEHEKQENDGQTKQVKYVIYEVLT